MYMYRPYIYTYHFETIFDFIVFCTKASTGIKVEAGATIDGCPLCEPAKARPGASETIKKQ